MLRCIHFLLQVFHISPLRFFIFIFPKFGGKSQTNVYFNVKKKTEIMHEIRDLVNRASGDSIAPGGLPTALSSFLERKNQMFYSAKGAELFILELLETTSCIYSLINRIVRFSLSSLSSTSPSSSSLSSLPLPPSLSLPFPSPSSSSLSSL